MDPRFLRSRSRLRESVIAIASERSIDSVSVAQICREAGVTRDTFYRHASSPLDLLSATLTDEITLAITPELGPDGTLGGRNGLRSGERALLTHVAARAAVYRNALNPTLPSLLRGNFESVIRGVLVKHLRTFPAALPSAVDAQDVAAVEMVAAYAASGTVGAIERWLMIPDLDVESGVRTILASAPEFWFEENE